MNQRFSSEMLAPKSSALLGLVLAAAPLTMVALPSPRPH